MILLPIFSITTTFLPVGPLAPVVIPQKPHPHWSWDRIPTAFQGAQKDRAFNADEVSRLAKYQMLTLEKWYTPCASQGPTQSGPACDVEDKMLQLYALTKAISPKQIAIFYWNTMFDFAFYKAHGHMLAMEAAGLPSFLRDEHGEIMRLCNDGNVYCNITTFDWTQPHVRELWVDTVLNMTSTGWHHDWPKSAQAPRSQSALQRCGSPRAVLQFHRGVYGVL